MDTDLAAIFEDFNSILVICPCCGEVIRLGDARPFLKGHKPATPFDRLERVTRHLEILEEGMEARLAQWRECSRERGIKQAKQRLQQIDPVFSGSGIDPQDVKILFDPVPFVIFDGMNGEALRRVLLLADEPVSCAQEQAVDSIDQAIRMGHVEFMTLRVSKDGSLERE